MAAKKKAGKKASGAPSRARRTRRTDEELLADLEAKLAAAKRRLSQSKRKKSRSKEARDRNLPRFSPVWLASHRERLQLSAKDYGLLVGVSSLTIYNWEKGRTRPRTKQLEALASVRGLRKREAWDRLESMGY